MNDTATKVGTLCGAVKSINEFYRRNGTKCGHVPRCKACSKWMAHEWHIRNKEKHADSLRKWRKNNLEKYRAQATSYRKENSEKRYEYNKEWQAANPERYAKIRQRCTAKRLSTAQGAINNRMRSAIWQAITGKKGGRKWESLVGYTLNDLMTHLEKHFLDGMSWENIGEWHIDHKIPKAAFHYEAAEDIDFKKCWALKNLLPMWATDNIIKSDSVSKPHQPSLNIAI